MNIKKSNKANIDRRRGVYLQVGFVSALALTLVAFEWSVFSVEDKKDVTVIMAEETMTIPPNVTIEVPKKEPEPEQDRNSEEIIIVKKEPEKKKVILPPKDSVIEINDTFDIIKIGPPIDPPDTTDWNKIFEVVEDKPNYPGGLAKMYEYLGKELHYPRDASSNGVQGKVFVSFVVDTDGSVTEVKTLNYLFPSCDKEAKRVIKKMKKWSPGKQRGRAVKVRMTVPIVFRLQ
jgi:protein TonB